MNKMDNISKEKSKQDLNKISKLFFILSQDNTALAKLEVQELLETNIDIKEEFIGEAQIEKKQFEKISRLAFTKKVVEKLFECNVKDLEKELERFDFSKIYKKDFCLRIHSISSSKTFNEANYAKFIWIALETKSIKPKVNLKNSSTNIEVYIIKNVAYITKLIWENNERFEDRKAHLKPELHPTAMHPKLARALVNILNTKKIIDPFCGAGGILIEACLMNLETHGFDIDKIMLERARINIAHCNISKTKYVLKQQDATKFKNIENLVSDLPYGKSSKKSDEIIKLYSEFVKNISGKAVIVMPNFVDYKNILKKNLSKKLIVTNIIDHYVHKSLTRKIILIKKR